MKINTSQTQELFTCLRKGSSHAVNSPNTVVHDKPIVRVSQARELGVILSMYYDVDFVVSRACKRLYMLY